MKTQLGNGVCDKPWKNGLNLNGSLEFVHKSSSNLQVIMINVDTCQKHTLFSYRKSFSDLRNKNR